jgi:hypothetical protein
MSRSQPLVRPTTDLLLRAAAVSLNSARIIAHSVTLIAHSVELMQKAARTCEPKCAVKVDALRARTRFRQPAPHAAIAGSLDHVVLLPLTPSRLLEVAEEFRGLGGEGGKTKSREGRAAFEDLVFRYTALAAGYDYDRVGSRMMH